MDEQQIIAFHIGPAQDFIASARRSRDLWFGSWLLSELSKAAALTIVDKEGKQVDCLVFPAAKDLAELKSTDFLVPNKVVALVTQEPKGLAKEVKEAVIERLQEIRNKAFDKVNGKWHPDRATAECQVKDLLEFYWAACPVNGNYPYARSVAESVLAARKVTRGFPAVPWGNYESRSVPKSSLDGQRESVIPEEVYDKVRNGLMTHEELRQKYDVRPGERLCGVGLLKRHGERGSGEDRFFSTSHVAALPLLEQFTDKKSAEEYFAALRKLEIPSDAFDTSPRYHPAFSHNDGHLLFEERLSDFFDDKGKLDLAKKALRCLLKTPCLKDKKPPIPYYALLLADGDRMGKAIDAQKDDPNHRALSQGLSAFAGKVKNIVEQDHKGSLVYAGGDDVLAFVPLHKVLACARCLAEAFKADLAGFSFAENGKKLSPTLSVGIAVSHHLDPLSDALTLARAAEKAAKAVPGKDALAVTVSKRSGADRSVADSWGKLDGRLNYFVWLHRADEIPDGAAYELRDLALRLKPPSDATDREKVTLLEVQRLEAKRVLKRKQPKRGSQEELADRVLNNLRAFIDRIDHKDWTLEQLADEIIIARLFADATEQAGITPEELAGRLPEEVMQS